jgi:hypothetical protein
MFCDSRGGRLMQILLYWIVAARPCFENGQIEKFIDAWAGSQFGAADTI